MMNLLIYCYFNNNTTNEQSYLLKTERFTRSIFQFNFTSSLIKSEETFLMFRLPEEIVELSGGIKREQTVKLELDT